MREATTATRYGHNLHILWPILNENAAKRKAAGETQIKMYTISTIYGLISSEINRETGNQAMMQNAETATEKS